MARPMPRSRALRLLGGALVSAAVPGLAPKRARAAPLKGCDPKACGTNTVCGMELLAGCTLACCSKRNPICFKWTGVETWNPIGGLGGYCAAHAAIPAAGEVARVVCCCPPGSVKGKLPAEPPCMCKDPCGAKKECCQRDQYCAKGGCTDCEDGEEQGFKKCGPNCCHPHEDCVDPRGLCCNNRSSKVPEEACIASNPIRHQKVALCCNAKTERCCHFVDDKKDIVRADCCSASQRCVEGKCV
jgi:hypothetical protein